MQTGSPALGPARSTEIDAGDALDGFDHFEHRKTVAVAAIERDRWRARPHIAHRIAMRASQIADVDVVAHAGAVRRRIIGAENVQLGRVPSAVSTATLIRCVAALVDWPVRRLDPRRRH